MPPDLTERLKPLIIIDKGRGNQHVLKVARSILGAHLVEESHPSEIEPDKVFVAMPFSDTSLDTYTTISRAVINLRKGTKAYRVDSKPGSFPVLQEIERAIDSCWLVVCDLTDEKPNVYYELGYAVARGKRVICIAKRGTNLHFDVAGRRILFFDSFTHLELALHKELVELAAETE
jgi:hypothetical protein